jgi:hypothetical protein
LEPLDSCLHYRLLSEEGFPRPCQNLNSVSNATSVETLDGAAVLVDEDDADEDVGSIVDESEKDEQV